MTSQRYNQIAHKYISEGSELHSASREIEMRKCIISRLESLQCSREVIDRQRSKIQNILADGKHKDVEYGERELCNLLCS